MTEISLTTEDVTGFQQIEFRRGGRLVISTLTANGDWYSRLYVNGGGTPTSIRVKHKTGRSVRDWAEKALAN